MPRARLRIFGLDQNPLRHPAAALQALRIRLHYMASRREDRLKLIERSRPALRHPAAALK